MFKVLDSTVLIDHLRGRPVVQRLVELRRAGDVPCTTAINVEEIVRGLRPGEQRSAELLFSGLVVFAIDAAAGRQAGTWRQEHASRGVTLFQADCLIAASAYGHHATLVTGNPKDFPMPELSLEHWPVGT